MLPHNSQVSTYNSLTTSCLSYDDFPAPSHNSFLLQNQQFITCDQEPKLNINAGRIRRRSDRHSKIHTKKGLRDRRVRLSHKVAHKFFKLQDLLGFDKASATLDWLIKQSRVSIEQHLNVNLSDSEFIIKKPQKDITPRKVLKSTNERRNEARTRARERTAEKKRKLLMERINKEDVYDQCLFSEDVSNPCSKFDVEYYCQDYVGTSNDDYLNSWYEQLNGDFFTGL